MKLKTKMIVSMTVVFLLFTIASGLGLFGVYQSQVKFERFLETDVALQQAESEMYAQGLQLGQALRNIILAPENKTAYKNHEMAATDFNAAMARAISLSVYDPDTQAVLKEIAELRKKQEDVQANIIALAQQDRAQAIEAVNKGETPLWRSIKAKLLDVTKKRDEAVERTKTATLEFTNQSLIVSSALIVSAIIFGILVSAWLIRAITRPLEYAVSIAKTTAAGDLSSDIQVTSSDETGQLMQALKDMTENLQRTVSEVRAGAQLIASASTQIAAGNADLASRTEAQAGSVQQTASTMEQITSNVRMNAENAREANDLAVAASSVAIRGGVLRWLQPKYGAWRSVLPGLPVRSRT
ncbi:methyl-accepting chemotaxis protein [Oxalobacter vibrioformis]|nr:HAMP domain-containing protein [Oxalobacter vibrioformis]